MKLCVLILHVLMYTMKISFKQIIPPCLIKYCTLSVEKNIHGKKEAFLPLELLYQDNREYERS